MSPEKHPAVENVHYLRQGIDLIRQLEPARYVAVGPHFRHCLDFYRCFLASVETSHIDYSCRDRDPKVESDPSFAAATFEEVCDRLTGLDEAFLDQAIRVRVERSEDGALAEEESPDSCGSTPMRELQFLVSHTVHHYAIIKLHLQLNGMDVEDLKDFGVAPSTRSHWQRTG